MQPYYRFIAIFAIVALLATGADVLVRRGPAHDATAVTDLRSLQTSVDDYFLAHDRLPANLNALPAASQPLHDRLSHYEYRRTGARSYQLCATFQTNHIATYNAAAPGRPDPDNHGKGRQCFTYSVIAIK